MKGNNIYITFRKELVSILQAKIESYYINKWTHIYNFEVNFAIVTCLITFDLIRLTIIVFFDCSLTRVKSTSMPYRCKTYYFASSNSAPMADFVGLLPISIRKTIFENIFFILAW